MKIAKGETFEVAPVDGSAIGRSVLFMKTMGKTLIAASEGADLLLLEATYGENEQDLLAIDHGHMNFAQAAEVAAKAGAKELWLAHFSQMIQDPEEYLTNAAEIFENTKCGQEGMKTTLQFEKDEKEA